MANIADNLKRLLGTEGNNIQEVLENADSIGGGSSDIPMIEFVQDENDYWSVDKTVGIDDVERYLGPCIIKSTSGVGDIKTFIGNAFDSVYGATAFSGASTIDYFIFTVSNDEVNQYIYSATLS